MAHGRGNRRLPARPPPIREDALIASQRLLVTASPIIAAAVPEGLALTDDEIGAAAPGLALAGALHETQYSRLFRS
ncbi:MAG: hypothetical protein WAT67_00895 [Candidatus Contendobacter sp.]